MPPTVAIIFMLSLLTFRLLTTVIHELGHAIPALLLTKEKVSVYMGSHGDPKKSMYFRIGRLECFFKFNLFYWKGGLCVMHENEISLLKNFIITISGPLLSFLVAGITTLLIVYGDFSDVTTLVLFALIFSCTLDFIHNIIPNKDSVALYDGTIVHNDGMQLVYMIKYQNAHKKYEIGVHHFNNEEYEIAAEKFEEVLAIRNDHEVFYRLTVYANLMIKNYEKAKVFQDIFTDKFKSKFDMNDFVNLGIIQNRYHEYQDAIQTYTEALDIDPNHSVILNNRGYAYGLLHRHEEAIIDLNKAISLDENFAFSWNNRGFSKLKLGQFEDGLLDIQKSLALDAENAYAYRNLGLYYFLKKDYQKALDLYEKALEMDTTTYRIQEYIDEVNAEINS